MAAEYSMHSSWLLYFFPSVCIIFPIWRTKRQLTQRFCLPNIYQGYLEKEAHKWTPVHMTKCRRDSPKWLTAQGCQRRPLRAGDLSLSMQTKGEEHSIDKQLSWKAFENWGGVHYQGDKRKFAAGGIQRKREKTAKGLEEDHCAKELTD